MKYQNPVLSGFYPDPSVTTDGKKFYLVNSTFQFFPGVTLFESDNLVKWKQIGHVLTRPSQLPLTDAYASGGIFAPTIRYNDGRFYMITTNVTNGGNFLVYTDDIYGEWSEPVWLHLQGIDPSLLFADGKCYFCGNGTDEAGKSGVFVNEIIPESGECVTEPVCVWHGNGGRFLEGPHLYKINDWYYLMAAEGGTEYGHMEIYARSKSPYGPFEGYKGNPFLTNRNKGAYPIQGVGHADLVQDTKGDWWLIHLAFRQLSKWGLFHITGRETYLVPVTFDEEGWFTAGVDGYTPLEIETDRLPEDLQQELEYKYTLANTALYREWMSSRLPLGEACVYDAENEKVTLTGTDTSLFADRGNAAVMLLRQKEMYGYANCHIALEKGEAGFTLYMDQHHHYDVLLRDTNGTGELVLRLCVGDIVHDQTVIDIGEDREADVHVEFMPFNYTFEAKASGKMEYLGSASTKYLSTEVAEGFTGVLMGFFTEPDSKAEFSAFETLMKRFGEKDDFEKEHE